MPDVGLVASFVGGGALIGLMNVGLRIREFRREDLARWAVDKREAYAAYIEHMTQFLGESAPLSSYLSVGEALAWDNLSEDTQRVGNTAFEAWLASHEARGSIRLLASRTCLDELGRLEAAIRRPLQWVIQCQILGKADDPKGFDAARASAEEALERFTDAARRDIGAEYLPLLKRLALGWTT